MQHTAIPLGLVLKNAIEVLTHGEKTYITEPRRVLRAGNLFGVFEIADFLVNGPTEKPRWTLHAGARTLVPIWQTISPHVNDILGLPKHESHEKQLWHEAFWGVIRKKVQGADESWRAEVLFVDADWGSLMPGDPLRAHIFETAWRYSRDIRYEYLDLTTKHPFITRIVRIARGEALGFGPLPEGDELGPFSRYYEQLFNRLKPPAKPELDIAEWWKRHPALPIVLFPVGLKETPTARNNVIYYSLNNPFISVPGASAIEASKSKQSQSLALIAKDMKFELRKHANLGIDVHFFVPDNAEELDETKRPKPENISGYSHFKSVHFKSDFENELSIARATGWGKGHPKMQQEAIYEAAVGENALTARGHGFLNSFVRITRRTS